MSIEELIINSPFAIREFFINMYGFYLSRNRFNRLFYHAFDELMFNLTKTPDQIKREQFDKLKETLIYSYENVPYYKETFNKIEFNPYAFNHEVELRKIPLLDKATIRENYNKLQNANYPKKKIKPHTTSGSTGEKLKFLQSKELKYTLNAAFMYRFYALHGVKIKDKRITIGGRRFTNKPPYWSYNKFENQLLLSSHHLNNNTGIEYIKKINEFKPIFIQGHPNSILFLANIINNGNAEISIPLTAIFTTGETLLEENRIKIEKAFETRVFQQYGSGESCFSAQETPERIGYMLNYEHGYVEMIGDGKYKEIVATSFLNQPMPFIRYRIGDLVHPISIIKQNKYPFPFLFDEVLGRTDDILVTINGEQILPVTIRMLIKPFMYPNTNYQLIQNSINDFTINLIDYENRIDTKNVIKQLKGVLGERSYIHARYVETLTSKGGKIRNVVNKIDK